MHAPDGTQTALVAAPTPAQGPPRSVMTAMANRFGMEPAAFEATIRNTVFPRDGSREQLAAFLLVAKEYGLNPLTKEVYAFPAKGGGIVPIVSIDGWARIINDHPAFDGMEYVDDLDDKGELIAITCRMFRKDRSRPTETTEYLKECLRSTDVWKTWPRRMLRHKATIQCARMAFGFSGIVDPDEYERMVDPQPARQVRTLHGGFDDPGPAVVNATRALRPEEAQAFLEGDFVAADPDAPTGGPDARATGPEDLGIDLWGKWITHDAARFVDVDDLRAQWDARKDELREHDAEAWKQANHAVANAAMAIGAGA